VHAAKELRENASKIYFVNLVSTYDAANAALHLVSSVFAKLQVRSKHLNVKDIASVVNRLGRTQ